MKDKKQRIKNDEKDKKQRNADGITGGKVGQFVKDALFAEQPKKRDTESIEMQVYKEEKAIETEMAKMMIESHRMRQQVYKNIFPLHFG